MASFGRPNEEAAVLSVENLVDIWEYQNRHFDKFSFIYSRFTHVFKQR